MRRRCFAVFAACALGICAPVKPAFSNVIDFETLANSVANGQPVDAKVTFTTSLDTVTILLQNLEANPTSVTQNLTGLEFSIIGELNVGTLLSSSGVERTLNGKGAGQYTNGPAVAMGWSLATIGSDLKLNLLGTGTAPKHTIIGPPSAGNAYTKGNGSIFNGPHNPFIGESATFVLHVPGVTTNTDIAGASFQFNTSPGTEIYVGVVPEPAIGASLLLTLALMRRRCGV